MLARAKTLLLASLVLCLLVSWGSGYINAYYLDVIIGIGINIILAVSLNLVNGYTGQFSLGHAGFMAVGAYTSAAIPLFVGPKLLAGLGGSSTATTSLLFLSALIGGGLMAAVAGLFV